MLSLGLTTSQEEAFNAALVDERRKVRCTAQLYNKRGEPLAKQLTILDGVVVVDSTSAREEPSRTAMVTLLDPHRQLIIDATHPEDGELWFAKLIELRYGVYVSSLARFVDVPVFHGPVVEVARRGVEVDIDATGKDAQHIPPYAFPRSFGVPRNTKIHAAIRDIFERRGETRFSLDPTTKRLARHKTWAAGNSPWKAGKNLADAVDRQLFYRANGTLRLRDLPETPSWRFREGTDAVVIDDAEERFSIVDVFNSVLVRGEKTVNVMIKTETKMTEKSAVGATSIKVASSNQIQAGRAIEIGGAGGSPETRKVAGSYTPGSLTVPLSRALDKKHSEGAAVRIRHREDRARPVIARADLTQSHPLSPDALTGGKRPRLRIEDRPNIHKKKKAQERADKLVKRMKVGVEQDIALSVIPIPHLEEGDLVLVDVGGISKRFRLKRFTIPLRPDASMEIGWIGTQLPRRR